MESHNNILQQILNNQNIILNKLNHLESKLNINTEISNDTINIDDWFKNIDINDNIIPLLENNTLEETMFSIIKLNCYDNIPFNVHHNKNYTQFFIFCDQWIFCTNELWEKKLDILYKKLFAPLKQNNVASTHILDKLIGNTNNYKNNVFKNVKNKLQSFLIEKNNTL